MIFLKLIKWCYIDICDKYGDTLGRYTLCEDALNDIIEKYAGEDIIKLTAYRMREKGYDLDFLAIILNV